jgi:hypothetical protein
MAAVRARPDVGGAVQASMGPISFGAQSLDQTRLGRRQQLREHGEVEAACGAQPEGGAHVDAEDVSGRREPQLVLAGDQHVPGLVLLATDQSVLAVRAEPSVGSGFASGTGQPFLFAGPAVVGPSARLEMPAAIHHRQGTQRMILTIRTY